MRKPSTLRQLYPGTGFVLGAALLLGIPAVRADTILLRGGERLIGKVLAEESGKVRFKSQTLGMLEISRDGIERIELDAPLPPPAVAGSDAPAAAAAEKDSIVPAPPPGPSVPPGAVTAPPAVPVAGVQSAPASIPAVVASTLPPAAPAVVPVFYPWSGLKTEQDTFDWIQLKSGEWLKGKLKGIQEFSLEFDSEKMDLRTFDWEDVTRVRSPKLNSVWFGQALTTSGSLLITPEEVNVISTEGTTTYPRSDLLSITPTGSKERNNWTGKVALGVNLRAGNTTETSYNVSANLQRRTPLTRLKLDYLGNYSDINGVVSEENQRISTLFDYFFSRQLYVRFPDAEYYRDPIQNIEDRITLGGSVGYDLYRTAKFEWDLSAGPAYSSTRFISVEAGKNDKEDGFAAVFASHLDWQVTDKIEWIVDYRGQYTGKDSAGGTTQHMNSTVEFEIHKRLTLNVSLIWDRVGNPKADSNGVTPKPDDYRMITSLGIDF
jgi:putative salt-induced outer membrane protein YdiY